MRVSEEQLSVVEQQMRAIERSISDESTHEHDELASNKADRMKAVDWAANKRFEVSTFKFKFPRARTFELYRARSRLAGWLVNRTILKS